MKYITALTSTSVLLNHELTNRLSEVFGSRFGQREMPALRVVIAAGAEIEYLPIVRRGRLQMALHLGSKAEKIVPISFGPGETAMTSSLFAADRLAGDLVTAERSVMSFLPKQELEDLISSRGDLSLLLAKFLAARLREVQDRERGFLIRSVHARVTAALERARSASGNADVIEMTHEELATWAGVSRPKVSLALKRMERLGVVRLGRGYIELRKAVGT